MMSKNPIKTLVDKLSSDKQLYNSYNTVFIEPRGSREAVAEIVINQDFEEVGKALDEIKKEHPSSVYTQLPYYTFMGQVLDSVSSGKELPDIFKGYKPLEDYKMRVKKAFNSTEE
jgi:hypothetical protein